MPPTPPYLSIWFDFTHDQTPAYLVSLATWGSLPSYTIQEEGQATLQGKKGLSLPLSCLTLTQQQGNDAAGSLKRQKKRRGIGNAVSW